MVRDEGWGLGIRGFSFDARLGKGDLGLKVNGSGCTVQSRVLKSRAVGLPQAITALARGDYFGRQSCK